MGTSTSNKGTRGKDTPLIPSWLYSEIQIPSQQPNNEDDKNTLTSQPKPSSIAPSLPPIPPAADSNRFRAVRINFSRFARSGGSNHTSLKRALSGYISRAAGGSRNAAKRMGSSRKTAASLLGFLSDVSKRGIQNVLRSLKLESLVGQPVEEIFAGIKDYVCPEGGTVDAGIAIDSFIRTIIDLANEGFKNFENLNSNQIQTVMELFMTHTIEERIYNDIGTKSVTLPSDESQVEKTQQQLREFIQNAVSDALTSAIKSLEMMTQDKMIEFIDKVYEQSFTLLLAMTSAKKGKK